VGLLYAAYDVTPYSGWMHDDECPDEEEADDDEFLVEIELIDEGTNDVKSTPMGSLYSAVDGDVRGVLWEFDPK